MEFTNKEKIGLGICIFIILLFSGIVLLGNSQWNTNRLCNLNPEGCVCVICEDLNENEFGFVKEIPISERCNGIGENCIKYRYKTEDEKDEEIINE